jgi:Na+/H+-translocating membrane pyrophosphatase
VGEYFDMVKGWNSRIRTIYTIRGLYKSGGIILNENNEFIEYWRKERKKGRVKYVLNENKVLLFVIQPIVLIIIFLIGYIAQVYTGFTILTAHTVAKSLLIGSPTLIVPICTSLIEWRKNEKRYLELK